MSDFQFPIARKNGLVIQEMPDEVLVYDLEANKAHCLNETAAFVWRSCDGKNTVTDIAGLLKDGSGNAVSEELVWLAIDQLGDNQLLESSIPANFNRQSRREVIKKIGLAAVVAIPLVASVTAPTSVMAATSCACAAPAACAATACPSTVNCNLAAGGICQP